MKNKEASKSNLISKVLGLKNIDSFIENYDFEKFAKREVEEKFTFQKYNLSIIFYNFKGSVLKNEYSFLTLYINSRIIKEKN